VRLGEEIDEAQGFAYRSDGPAALRLRPPSPLCGEDKPLHRPVRIYVAAKMILRSGLPRTPAGVIYNRGTLLSYLDTLFIYLFGFSEGVARIPGVLVGALSLHLLNFVGNRLHSPP